MQNKLYSFLFTAATLLLFNKIYSQCTNLYLEPVYSNVTVETDTYSMIYGQALDIYQPVGDTSASRPLFIMAHGGSFYEGDKSESDIVALCTAFALRGYVCASINYRLTSELNLVDSVLMVNEVFEAVSDAKAAVRYFTKDAATINKFRINPKNVVLGGNSAGAVLAVQYAYLNSTNLLENNVAPYIVAIIDSNGGIEGNSGNPGYPDSIVAVTSLAGGINNLAWIVPGETPIVMCQGTADSVVPYGCNEIFRGIGYDSYQLIRLCGSGAMQPVLQSAGIENALLPFPGYGHVPWSTNDTLLAQVDTFVADFLSPIVCERMLVTSISNVNLPLSLSIYPNPANGLLNIRAGQNIQTIELIDELGRPVVKLGNINSIQKQIPVQTVAQGIYFLVATFDNSEQAIRRVEVQ